uniref:hypothetical protein n=1 Tax=uncultured Sphingomonas sp. TaxID=158754 RepID=UPI0035C9D880
MKKVFALTLMSACALSLAACGGHGAGNTSTDTTLANEDFAANDTLGNDTFGNDATLDANATSENVTIPEGNAL